MAIQLIDLGASANNGLGDKLRIGGDKINDNFTEIYDKLISDNFVVVKTLADFPAPVGAVITLLNDTTYFVTAEINTLGKFFVLGEGTVIKGTSCLTSRLYSSISIVGVYIQSNYSVDISDIKISSSFAFNAIDFAGDETTDSVRLSNILFEDFGFVGSIQNYKNVNFDNCFFKECDNLNFDLAIDNLHIDNCNLSTTSQLITIESTAVITNQFKVSNSYLYATGTGVLIEASASATYLASGYVLLNNSFRGGSSAYLAGLSSTDTESYFKNNIGITNTL